MAVAVLVALIAAPLASSLLGQQQGKGPGTPGAGTVIVPGQTVTASPTVTLSGLPHVQGNRIVDSSGRPVILRGAQIEGVFNVAQPGPTDLLATNDFASTVKVMGQQWHMNALRLPTCNWLWQANPTSYMSRLQTAVQQANAAGLYVVIEAHDDHRCNPPYNAQDPVHLPRPQLKAYWQAVANTFKNNPMVIFDVYNEPALRNVNRDQYTAQDWQLWLNGGQQNGETFTGMQELVDAVRSTGAQQIIMVEGYSFAETFYNIGSNVIHDPNIVYEIHEYGMNRTPDDWNKDFGFMSTTYPVFIGEWALMGGGNSGQVNCHNIAPSQANQVVLNFLNYMASHNMSWTAYAFTEGHMLQNYSAYTPTTFDFNWTCGQNSPVPGMGAVVKQYLLSH
ncbi:MAG TPA: glycoside hydrolase family 5 protein [Ktedonobacteraceae bacterium]|nr:glycoside hydrolase family 5 protein [Ktedonobacteraceae bacterium]